MVSEKKKKRAEEPEELKEQEITEEPEAEETPQTEEESAPAEDEEVLKLREENKELQDKLLRQMAEFDNFRKRTAREKAELYDDATAKCIGKVLTVIDNFERALSTETADEEFKKGVQMIFDQLMQVLKSMGVEEIDAIGKVFDPEFHNAVSRMDSEDFEENTVCQVFQKGFTYKGKVIRHAMVVVANS